MIDQIFLVSLFGALLLALLPLFSVLIFVFSKGLSRFDWPAFSQLPPPPNVGGGGFANALWGTIGIVSLGAAISVPVGGLAAIYLVEFGSLEQWPIVIRFAANVLNSVPSILLGVFVYSLIVLTTSVITLGKYSFSGVAGGIALAIVMTPIILRSTEESLLQVSTDIKMAAAAVGATPVQTTLQIVIPAALPAIVTGILLAIARAAGETAPLLFTALFNQYWARSIWDRSASLSVLIYEFSRSAFANQQDLAWTAALVLTLLILGTSLLSRWATRGHNSSW